MKKVLTFCSVLMMVMVNASDNKSEPIVEPESNNVNPDMQLIEPEVLPVEVDKIKKQRIEKSVREKKYAESVLKNQKSVSKHQNDVIESILEKNKKKDAAMKKELAAIKDNMNDLKKLLSNKDNAGFSFSFFVG